MMFIAEHISFSVIEFRFFNVFREKEERIKSFLFSQNVPKISSQEGTANGSEYLSLYLIHVYCFISSDVHICH